MQRLSSTDHRQVRRQAARFNTPLQRVFTVALPGRPSNYLLQEFNRLVAKPNQLWGGGKARTGERLQQTRDFLSNVEAQLQEVLSNPGGYTRAQVGVARTKATQVREMRGAYEQILRRGGMSGNASGTTNGVGWRIVE